MRLVHTGAAASSTRHCVKYLNESTIVFASHSLLHLATLQTVKLANGIQDEPVYQISASLRRPDTSSGVITCISTVTDQDIIACGFNDGTVGLWRRDSRDGAWYESILQSGKRSITTIDCLVLDDNQKEIVILTGSSDGALLTSVTSASTVTTLLYDHPVACVRIVRHQNVTLVFVGSASPRFNKIHVYYGHGGSTTTLVHAGALVGHEDWITSFDCTIMDDNSLLLASASQDAKIRLWKFTAGVTSTVDIPGSLAATEEEDSVLDDDLLQDEEDDADGEARLEWIHNKVITRVYLEALLIGHEDKITGVQWHPDPYSIYAQKHMLVSSSMDRILLLWCPGEDGIWTPLTRVGSAGGILGGSVGSSLLGYCGLALEPKRGRTMIGHAYGGSLHVWNLKDDGIVHSSGVGVADTVEDHVAMMRWKAVPCVTGHFEGVVDLSWEASNGSYLLTAGKDQTVRMWAPLQTCGRLKQDDNVWLEIGRPQVHGYDLASVESLSTPDHAHFMVSGSDEKELRAFDAPKTAIRCLKATIGLEVPPGDIPRMERAYVPSLGLSNKPNASDGAEEDKGSEYQQQRMETASLEQMRLPLERDLGAVSLWPESQKLFGHISELYCVTSTLSSRTAKCYHPLPDSPVIVASSCKARDEESATIRMWDVENAQCLQVLSGHKSTVATLAFSPTGNYFASSGKDRRLCLWKRNDPSDTESLFSLAWAKESAHKRIIWSVHFCPFDDTRMVSGSRDGCIRLWQITDGQMNEIYNFSPEKLINDKACSVTALSIAPVPLEEDGSVILLAVGLESGDLELWQLPSEHGQHPTLWQSVDSMCCHNSTITKLVWKPLSMHEYQTRRLTLASSSLDHSCRIFQLNL